MVIVTDDRDGSLSGYPLSPSEYTGRYCFLGKLNFLIVAVLETLDCFGRRAEGPHEAAHPVLLPQVGSQLGSKTAIGVPFSLFDKVLGDEGGPESNCQDA